MKDTDLDLELDMDIVDDFAEPEPVKTLPLKKFTEPKSDEPIIPPPTPTASYEAHYGDVVKLFDFEGTKLSPLQKVYIMAFAAKGTKTGACRVSGIPIARVEKWSEDEEFCRVLSGAVDVMRDTLEEELIRRAMAGSDKLLLEAVRASHPEKYNRRQTDVNVNAHMVHTWADLAKEATVATPKEVIEASYEKVDDDTEGKK